MSVALRILRRQRKWVAAYARRNGAKHAHDLQDREKVRRLRKVVILLNKIQAAEKIAYLLEQRKDNSKVCFCLTEIKGPRTLFRCSKGKRVWRERLSSCNRRLIRAARKPKGFTTK